MFRSFPLRWLLVLSTLSLFSCEDHTILHPGFPEPFDDTVLLDFTYRKSASYYGFAKFQLLSNNIVAFEWSFGFLDQNGTLVKSTSSSPGIFFPANGNYEITLKGTDHKFRDIAVSKIISITNYP